jgi:hypothetical protein
MQFGISSHGICPIIITAVVQEEAKKVIIQLNG